MKNYILKKEKIDKIMIRLAYEIAERNVGEEEIILAGVQENGSVIARKLRDLVQPVFKGRIHILDVTVDNKRYPRRIELNEKQNFDEKVIIVVDDVANSGKTMLYVLGLFLQDHPRNIQTLALVDRTHKTFPVHTDYFGYAVATTLQEHIFVEVNKGEITGAWLE